MSSLERFVPAPRLRETAHATVGAPAGRVWDEVRHGDLAGFSATRALFWIRTLGERLGRDGQPELGFRVDDLVSSPDHPGFRLLAEDAPRELVVGAIGKVWKSRIPFVHVADAEAFAQFAEPGFIKVAWSIRVLPMGEDVACVAFELRVDATDEEAWQRFQRYFALIGPFSRFIRRTLLAGLVRRLGSPEARERERALPGDELLPDAAAGLTHGVTIAATPAEIWPWLLQMGCRRAGFYSVDWLDNRGVRSARELHAEWTDLREGQVIPATPSGEEGFEVLRVDAPHTLILGGLYGSRAVRQLAFAGPRPDVYWQVTWAFVLVPIDADHTRLLVRARAAFPGGRGRLRLAAIRHVHGFMERVQLRHLAARVEKRLPRNDFHDVLEATGGAAVIGAAFLTPSWRSRRARWGVPEEDAERVYPGDELVPSPRWAFTHGVEIDAPTEAVWPWIAQIGADRAGFYSYQMLENLAGCNLRNAETVHPEWEVAPGGALRLHPDMPAMRIEAMERGHHFVAHAPADEEARRAGKPWVEASWAFVLDPLPEGRCRLTSRYRTGSSDDLRTRLAFGPAFVEPISFAMGRRMLLGIKKRTERTHHAAPLRSLRGAEAVRLASPAG